MRDMWLNRQWKRLPDVVRRSLVFVLGLCLVVVAPFIGALPGPGGIIIFLAGIAVLASEFDWAENLREVVTKTVPEEVKRRWRPTPRWQVTFDVTTVGLLVAASVCYINSLFAPVISLTATAIAIATFNRNRLERLKSRLKRKR